MVRNFDKRLYNSALKIISIVRTLPKEVASYEIGRQLLRAGTSIVANYEEARGAFSREDFIYKINICFKEARETNVWLKLLKNSGFLNNTEIENVIRQSEGMRNILGKSVSALSCIS